MNTFNVGDVVTRKAVAYNRLWSAASAGVDSAELEVHAVEYTVLMVRGVPGWWDYRDFNLVRGRVSNSSGTVDVVNSPKHYQFFTDLEAIEVIARSMTREQFYGYCLGNRLKYRLRAGNKDKLEQDIAKSDKYLELYEKHKGLCSDAE